jgi:uncharacterized protein (TIGR03083 family)
MRDTHPPDKHTTHLALVERLARQAEDVRRLTSGLDDTQLATRTIPEKWSLLELVCHMWRVQQVFAGRLQAMLAEEEPVLPAYSPDKDAEFDRMAARPASEVRTDFLRDRDHFNARLKELSPAEWHRRGRHPAYPHYDVHFLVEYLAHHEAHHIYQLLERRAPLGPLPH